MRKTLYSVVTAACLCCVSLLAVGQNSISARSQGDLGNGTFLNPILGGDYPDPSIVRDGDDYYMTHSAFDYVPGLAVFHSKDLVNWEPISFGLKTYLGAPIWAPDICKYKGKYYIYFTLARSKRTNYVVWADSPYGPWSDPIDLKIGQIDPCHVVGEDGQRWLFLSAGHRAKLTDDGLAIVPGTFEKVYEGWKYPNEWVTEGFCLEGPKLRKIGEYYYYLNAEGGTAGAPTSHMITVARSKSVNGPWINDPHNPLVHTYNNTDRWWSRGHGSLIDTPDGKWWIVYHAYENQHTNLGRQTLLEPVELGEDGWFTAPLGTRIEKPIAKPIASQKVIDRKTCLNQFRIGLDWKYYKRYDPNRLQVNNGVLTMQAQGDSPDSSAPMMFVAGLHKYEVSVKIEKTDSAVAGLVFYYNAGYYVGTGFDSKNRLRWRKGALKSRAINKGGNSLWLKIKNDDSVITGYFSYDGKIWEKEDWSMEISGYNHNTLYDFQSVLPGLFVYGKGRAKFSELKFNELK